MPPHSKLTPEQIAEDTKHLEPLTGECIILPFVRGRNGHYYLAATLECSWPELLTYYQPRRPADATTRRP